MPGMNGIELQSTLIAQRRNIPIIFISAFRNEAVEAAAKKAGAIGFLHKPFDPSLIECCIKKALNLHNQR
jgi:FixJ family two-component response regulator